MQQRIEQLKAWMRREAGPRLSAAQAAALDLILPPQCLSCAAPVTEPGHLCGSCWNAIDFLDGPACATCGTPFETQELDGAICGACTREPPAYDQARAVMRYDDKAKGLILAFKHADRLEGTRSFGRWMARAGAAFVAQADIITSVPLHRRRLISRKYNQAALLAQALAAASGCSFDPMLLERKRATPTQGGLTRRQRRHNVAGAFRIRPGWEDRIRGARIVVVDDVITTGATVETCARTLKRGGASGIDVLTLARVVLPK